MADESVSGFIIDDYPPSRPSFVPVDRPGAAGGADEAAAHRQDDPAMWTGARGSNKQNDKDCEGENTER